MADQPKSLLLCSAIQAAHYLSHEKRIKLDSSILPQPLIEEVACQLKSINLAEFILDNHSLLMLKEQFSVDGFQRLLFHFFRQIEICQNRHTKKIFHQIYDDFHLSFSTYKLKHILIPHNAPYHFVNVFDSPIAALGIGFYQLHVDHLHEFKFFQSKFERIQFFEKFPVPHIPMALEAFIPQNVKIEDYLPDIMFQENINIERPLTEENTFFCLLTAMSEAYRYGRHSETLAYAFELLDIPEKEFSRRYYLHVYGMLAVTLAKLHVNLSWSSSCLEKTGQYLDIFSQQVTALFYHQQFYAATGQYLMQEELFYKLLDLVPLASSLHNQIVQCHFCCFFNELEISMLQVLCMNNDVENQTENKDKKFILQQRIRKHLEKQKRLLHFLLSERNPNSDDIEFLLDLFHLYYLTFDKLKTPNLETFDDRIEILSTKFNYHYHHADHFLLYQSDGQFFNYHDYLDKMDDERVKSNLHFHTKNSEYWGHICFTHFLFMAILAENQTAAEFWLQEARDIYKKLNNPKHHLCTLYLEKKSSFKKPSFDVETFQFTVPGLLTASPFLCPLVRLGITLVEKFNSIP